MRVAVRLALSSLLVVFLAGCFGEAAINVESSQSASVAPPSPPPAAGDAGKALKPLPAAPTEQSVQASSQTAEEPAGGQTEKAPAASVQEPPVSPRPEAVPEKAEVPDAAASQAPKTPQTSEAASDSGDKNITLAALDVSAPAPAPAESTAGSIPRASGKHIAVVGDSLAVGVGMTMEKNLKQYEGVACTAMGKVSTGLIAKKKYDWDRTLEDLIATKHPDALVVVMGGNDSNNNIGGKAAGSDSWKEAYSGKVKEFLKIASDGGVLVFWAGLPIMKEQGFSKRVEAANEAAKNACQAFSNCVYIDSWSMFADENGDYASEKAINGGKIVSLRAKDGVHLTMTGYDYLCREILDKVARNVELKPRSNEK